MEEDLETLAQSVPVTKSATDVVDEDDAAELPAPSGVHSSPNCSSPSPAAPASPSTRRCA